MTITKTCSTCEHFPNDHHCVGCVWDENKRENTKWELKENPIVIERKVLEQIRDEIERLHYHPKLDFIKNDEVVEMALDIIDKYRTESEDKE